MKIYHNPRCSKSRQTLAILEEKGAEPEIIKYLDNPPGAEELKELIQLLGIQPEELVRKSESIFKEKYKGRELNDDEWIAAMAAHPKLIQRPIVVGEQRAVIGRPPEKVLALLGE
ncbi:MAG: arsenate reductase (glutaredoxin) [Balneolaceae bacterium]|nr:arsenate reductase (glutaredoxin) [Balneolaceae bacterium]